MRGEKRRKKTKKMSKTHTKNDSRTGWRRRGRKKPPKRKATGEKNKQEKVRVNLVNDKEEVIKKKKKRRAKKQKKNEFAVDGRRNNQSFVEVGNVIKRKFTRDDTLVWLYFSAGFRRKAFCRF